MIRDIVLPDRLVQHRVEIVFGFAGIAQALDQIGVIRLALFYARLR
jgi:hypothetical protein